MDLGNGFRFRDQKDLEVQGSSWIPITPVRPTLPRRPPIAAGDSPVSQPLSPNNRIESAATPGSLQSTGSFFRGSQWHHVGCHTLGLTNPTDNQQHFSNCEAVAASESQIHHQLPKQNVQFTRQPVRQWTQIPLGNNAHHPYSPLTFTGLIGASQQQAQDQQSILLNGKVPLYPQAYSGGSQMGQVSQNGASNPYLPNIYNFYSPQDTRRMVGNDTTWTAFGPSTPDKCNRVHDGHIIESIDSEDRRSSIGEHRQSKHHTVSNVKDAIQLSFNQGAALPATLSYGEFSLLLENQHQKAENRLADSNRAAPVPLAPVTPEKCNRIHDGLPAEVINLVDDGETEKNHQQLNGNHEIEKECMQICFNQGASGQTDMSPLECFQQQVENQEHENGEIQGIDLNKTPQQKTRKKKHRPKVIREGKPARKPRQVTPKSTGTTGLEKPSGKRKYVRKKKTDVDTPSTEIREASELGDRSVQRSAKRALNFDLEAQLNGGLEPFSLASVCNIESREHNDDRSSNNSGSNRNKLPISEGLEEVVEAAKFMFDLNNSTNKVSGNCAGPYENSDQDPAPSRRECIRENLNYLARKRELVEMRILSSGHTVHQSTPESIFTSNSSLYLSFADDTAVNEGLKRTCNHSCSAADQSHQDVIVSNYYTRQTENSINDMSLYEYNGDQVNHVSEMNKKKRKADGEMELTSNGIHFLPRGREDLNCPFEEEIACAKKLVAIGRQQDAEQLIAYVQTERKRTELSKAPTQVCSQLASTPTKSYDHKQVSSNVGNLGEGKTITVTPRRQKESHISSEQACQQDSEISACSTRKESQKNQTSPIKSKRSHRNRQEKLDSSSAFRVMARPVDPIDLIVQKMKGLIISEGHEENAIEGLQPQNALVLYHGDGTMVPFEGPLGPSRKRLPRAKVDLDSETNRVWMLLMGKEANDSAEALGKDKKKWWEEERRVFRGRVDSFIARMHLVQGDRRFSQWKGSVVDSVVGVFLTQNVSDHLSSSAFMALAARFPSESNGKSRESSIVNESIPTTNQVVTIVEIEDEFKLQDNMSSHLLDQHTSTFEKTYDTEEKGIEDVETPGRNTGDFLFGISNERIMDEFGEEKEPDVTSLTNKILAPLSLRQQMSSAEVDDVRSLENGISSQNSVVSSQNSSDSTTVDLVGLNLESNTDIDGILNGPRWNCLDASTPFMELLQLAGAGMFQELYPSKSGSAASKGSLANANNALESSGPEERKPGIDHIFKLNDACTSDNGVKSHQLCNVTRLPCVPSTSHFHSASVSGLIGMEGDDVSRKGPPFFTSFRSDSINTTCITNSSSMSPLVKDKTEISGQEELLSTSQSLFAVDSCRNTSQCSSKPLTSSRREVNFDENLPNHNYFLREWSESISNTNTPHKGLASSDGQTGKHEQNEREAILQKSAKGASEATAQSLDYRTFEHHSESTHCASTLDDAKSSNAIEKDREVSARTIGWMPAIGSCTIPDAPKVTAKGAVKPVSKKAEKERKDNFDWDSLRKEVCKSGAGKERSSSTMDSIDWKAVRNADVKEISNTIRERGMNNMLAERIKAFLDRLVREHGSIDLEWLRDVPPDKAKDYLLSIRGLGLKSVECVRLLTLHHLAFPVDTNVGRICVRLGWVPLQPLPESLQLHLLELYPMLETIQKYLWPRLCTLDQRTLYELHYQLITFGKVFCTKSKPNCNACPMRGECKHFASAFASARLALPGPEEKGLVPLTNPAASEMVHKPAIYPTPLPQLEVNPVSQRAIINNFEPIIEEPASPEPECLEYLESAIEDFYEDPDEIPTIKLNIEQFTQNLQDIFQGNYMELQDGDMSKALVALTPDVASIPQPKLKNVSRLRTEHQVYELPDFHPLLEGLDQREVDDPCPYLLAIWTPGETAQSTEPPDITCTAQDMGELCDRKTCFGCNSLREARSQKVRGTLLVPCRTAMRGSFPLNGTYFQVNEVFADHSSSLSPIDVPREWLWNLPRRTVYFGTSVTSIFRGLTTEGIQQCFWRGFVCVRGFDQKTRAPRPLLARLHFPASKAIKNKKTPANEA